MKKILILFIIINQAIFSQTIKKAVGLYSTEFKQKEIKGRSNQCTITLHTLTGLLTIEDNLTAIKVDDRASDTLDLKPYSVPFIFKSNIEKNISTILKNNKNANLIKTEGTLSINGITKETVAFWAPVQLDESSNEFLLQFELKFNADDFNLSGLYFPFTKLAQFNIENGLINKIE